MHHGCASLPMPGERLNVRRQRPWRAAAVRMRTARSIPAVLVAAGIACAGTAQADPNDEFNQYMNSHGLWQRSYLQDGYNTCSALRSGQTATQIINQLEGRVSVAEAQDIVFAARQYLCPGA